MIVFVLFNTGYDRVTGVFSTLERAQKYIDGQEYKALEIDEFEVDNLLKET